ncbi:Ig-like domain-containing protein [Brevundimonas pishanensis]|uniref:Ig-like domain-containing protein n=1 Tax=Brevundimonas pishanensis TaxID=2896315 RepID=UPI001FA8147C|nr:Ig-like domain-containing protein [Brevundimonas pishanensis]
MLKLDDMSGFSVHNVGKGDQVSGVSGQRDAFVIQAPPEDILNYAREGSDLVIQFRDGTNIRINGYFDQYDDGDQVVLVDGDRSFRVDFSDALSSEGDGIAEALVAYVPIGTENNALLALLGVAAAGAGLAAAVSGDDSPKVSEPTPPIRIPDKPAKPSSYVDNVGDVQSPSSTAATTDDTTPGINIGTGLTDKPKLYVNGVEIPSTYNAATGVLTPNAPLGEGRNTITITLTSPEGGESAPSEPLVITIDATAPSKPAAPTGYEDNVGDVQSANSTAASTDDTTPGINVGAGLTDTPRLYVNGVEVPATYDSTTGTLTPVSPLPEGSSTITYTLTDAAGNQSAPSDPLVITIDSTPPAKPSPATGYNDDAGPITDSSSNAPVTDDRTPGINVGPGLTDTPSLYVDSVKVPSTYDPATGTLTPVDPLPEGPHSITYTVTDPAGNESPPSDPIVFEVDTTPPSKPATPTGYNDDFGPITDANSTAPTTDDNTPGINVGPGLSPEPSLYVDGVKVPATYDPATGLLTPTTPLADGPHTLSYTVYDPAGNESPQSDPISFEVDTSAPGQPGVPTGYNDDVAPVTSPNSTAPVTNDPRPGLNVGAGLTDTPVLYVNGTKVAATYDQASGTLTPDVALTDGSYVLTYSLMDAAGNEGPQSPGLSLAIDTSAPTQSVLISGVDDNAAPTIGNVPSNGYTNDVAPLVSGTLSAGLLAGEYVEILRNGSVVGTATVTNSTWTFADTGLVDGLAYTYSARVKDAAGNQGAISNSYVINIDASDPTTTVAITDVLDNQAPTVGSVANGGTTNDSQPELVGTLTGTLNANEQIVIYRGTDRVGVATVNGSSWTFTDSGLTNGSSYSYTARVEDSAGNVGATSGAYGITLQTSGSTTTVLIADIEDNSTPVTGSVGNNGHTNDTTPQLSGTISAPLVAGEQVHIFRNGVDIGTATMSGTDWTFDDSGLNDGNAYTYTAVVIDSAGNQGAVSNGYTINVDTDVPGQTVVISRAVDNVDPVSGPIPANGTTNDDTPTLEGTLSAGLTGTEQLHVFRNNVFVGVATVSGTNWTYQDSGLASQSTYDYSARVVDAAGNAGTPSNTLTFTVNTDGVSQTTAIIDINDDFGPQTGSVLNNGTTNDTTPTLSGSIGAPLTGTETVQILRSTNGAAAVVVGTATVSATTWTFADTGLVNGNTYTYTAQVINTAGDVGGASNPYSITIDTAPPSATVALTGYSDNQPADTGELWLRQAYQ